MGSAIWHTLFWAGVLLATYSYFIYPAILATLPRKRSPERPAPDRSPFVSVIVTARNEQARIAEKLENTLVLRYPIDLLEVLVASDASNDGTDDIVRGYAARGVRLVRTEERGGKERAQHAAILVSRGSILLFTDVATRLAPDSLELTVPHFADPTIGAVSSSDELVTSDHGVQGEGAYVRYEMWLRKLESSLGGLIGLSGSCFAVRRRVCDGWRDDTPSDITVALLCANNRLRAVSDPRVKGMYASIADESREFGRKKRTIIRGMTAVWELRQTLNLLRYGLFAWQVWSHKIMRWLVPAGMALCLLASAVLTMRGYRLYSALFWIQVAGYAVALAGHLVPALRRLAAIRIATFFVAVNVATAAAAIDFLRGVRITTWNPSKR